MTKRKKVAARGRRLRINWVNLTIIIIIVSIVFAGLFSQSIASHLQPVQVKFGIINEVTTCTGSNPPTWCTAGGASSPLVAETWIDTRVDFADGSPSQHIVTGQQAVAFNFFDWVATVSGKPVSGMVIDVPAVTYDLSGYVRASSSGALFPWWITGTATVTIKVNDFTAFGPTAYNSVTACDPLSVRQYHTCDAPIGNLNLIPDTTFSLSDWMKANKLPAGTYTLTIEASESWTGYELATGGPHGLIGNPTQFGHTDLSFPQQISFPYSQTGQGPATFSITSSPDSITLGTKNGFTDRFSVTVLANQGFAGIVSISVTGLPGGVTASFDNPTSSLTSLQIYQSVLTISSSANANIGNYTLSITATSQQPAYSASHQVTLIIQQYGNPQTSLKGNSQVSLSADSTTVAPGTNVHLSGQLATSPAGIGFAGSVSIIPQWTNQTMKNAVAGSDGNFAVDVKMPTSEGTYLIVANFQGDATHSGTSSSITITVSAAASNSGNNGGGLACGTFQVPWGTVSLLPKQYQWLCGTTWGLPNVAVLFLMFIAGILVLIIIISLIGFGLRSAGRRVRKSWSSSRSQASEEKPTQPWVIHYGWPGQ